MEIHVKKWRYPSLLLFMFIDYDLIKYAYFLHSKACSTVIDDVTNCHA